MTNKQLDALKSAYRAMMDDYCDARKERDDAERWYSKRDDADSYKEATIAQAKMNAIISCAEKIGEILWDIDHDII